MKLIEQTFLVFRKGRSEKVYEVDLCQVGEGRFVVNFRYGRRGRRLFLIFVVALVVGVRLLLLARAESRRDRKRAS